MNTQVVNIFDQLLGVAEPGQAVNPSGVGEVSPDSQLFGDILRRLGVNFEQFESVRQLVDDHGQLEGDPAATVDDFLNEFTQATDGLSAEKLAALKAIFPGAALPVKAQPASDSGTIEAHSQTDSTLPQLNARFDGQAAQVKDPVVEKFAQRIAANPQLQKMLSSHPADLEPAVYKVLDSKLAGSRVELTVAGGAKAEPVKITVPAEMLAPLTRPQTGRRVAVDVSMRTDNNPALNGELIDNGSGYSDVTKRQLHQLFQNLKVKSIDLKIQTAQTQQDRTTNDIGVRLTVEHLGRQKVLAQRIPRHDIRTTGSSAPSKIHGTAEPQMVQSARTGEFALGIESSPKGSRPTTRPVAVPSQTTSIAAAPRPFDIADRFITFGESSNLKSSLVVDKSSSTASPNVPSRFAAEPAPVRIMLPDNFDRSGRPINQTLLLKIEPEHLGPARLHLSMRNDLLMAKVTVDTPMAKATVEQSLDQLTNQLARVGVEVDRIEVAVGGNGTRNEFLDRRPSWAQQTKSKQKYFDDDEEIEQVTPTVSRAAVQTGYVRESGVNLLA